MINYLAYSTDVPPDVAGKLMYGLEVTIIGVLIVFAVLALIMFVIYLFQGIFGRKHTSVSRESDAVTPETAVSVSVPSRASGETANAEELVAAIAAATAMAEEELIVVLSAAVAAQEGCDPANSRYRIRSFRRIL